MPADEKVNILVVDDQPSNLLALEATLAQLGLNLVTARSGREALRRLLHDEFALILLDVRMPDIDGLETAALIRGRERTRHVPIIFLTGYEHTDVQMFKGYSLGAVDYLTKPLMPEVLRSKVAVFVDLYRKTEQVRRQAEELRLNQQREHERRLAQEKQSWEMDRLRAEAEREKRVSEELARTGAEVAALKDELAAQLADMTQLHRLSARLSATLDLPAVLQEVLDAAVALQGADSGVLMLYDWERGDLHAAASAGLPEDYLIRLGRTPLGAGVYGAAGGGLAVVEDVEADGVAVPDPEAARRVGVRAACGVPLLTRGGAPVGALVTHFARPHRPSERDVRLIELYARQAAQAVENARLHGEIQEANRGKDEFLAMLAHELRNPLAPVLNAVHVLRLGARGADAESAQEMIERQTRHMARLVDDLLDVSRITRGKIQLRPEPVELSVVIGRAVDSTRPLLDERRHTVEVRVGPAPVLVLADATRVEQVLSNLLNNAAKYTEPGGRITLTAVAEGKEAVVRVRDTGIGIDRAMLPHVFDLFMQAHSTLDRAQGGLGIGLTLVRRLVELHGGTIEAHSAGLGQGSEFVVRLPLLEQAAPQERAAGPAAGKPRAQRVLVVDDNRDAAESLALLLRLDGHDVRVAHDGPAALEAAAAFGPEVVLLDIGLPRMSGHEVAARLLQQPHPGRCLLVAMTGYGQDEDRRRSHEAGFHHHLVKPVDPQTLRDLLACP
jgi:signal transduction histidine kinase/response regulator RpfG family c-di-GMP phosphodiesterase